MTTSLEHAPLTAHALVDDHDWCGHVFVDLVTWLCADCDRPVTRATRQRLESTPMKAPAGYVWVLTVGDQDPEAEDGYRDGFVLGIFSDRALIAARLVRERYAEAATVRAVIRNARWYQGAFNPWEIEGWALARDQQGRAPYYGLRTEKVDWPLGGGPRVNNARGEV